MSLPNWFVLQAPPNLDIDIDRWKNLAWKRAQLLEQLPNNPSEVVRDNFPTYDDALNEIYNDYRLGAYFLRLVAATNSRLEAWLIESEGDLFERLYYDRTESIDQKIEIFKTIFGSNNVMRYEVFKYEMDEEKNEILAELYNEFHSAPRGHRSRDFLICVHFSQVPWMVSNRKGYLRRGWVVSNESSFRGSLKKGFERVLQDQITESQNLLGIREEIDQAVQDIEQKLAAHSQIRSQFADTEFDIKDLQSHTEVFPPCMSYLTYEFEETRRLTHVHRLQLGFFLKKMGMSVDEQLRYWYEKAVDNVGISFTDFQRTSGYQIRHIYGLEGGKTDYDVPKCSTIATSYFCPFIHLAPNILVEYLNKNSLIRERKRSLTDAQLESYVSRSATNPTQTCSWYFQHIYGRSPSRKIVHPMQWVRYAIDIELKAGSKENKQSENQNERVRS